MALPTVASGTKLLIKIGDGGGTEVFDTAMTCAAISREVKLSADTNTIVVPDCDDPDAPAAQMREVTAYGMEVSADGVCKTTVTEAWFTWFKSGAAKNVRVEIGIAAASGGGYFACAAKVSDLSIKGDRGDKIQMSFTLVSDGAVTWTDAAS